jgi:Dolichyl-phosphate-mannose-protein mannosyltransferase
MATDAGMHAPRYYVWGTALAAVVGVALMGHSAWSTSATYDEVAYLRVASQWWRTGRQESITRMGSPLTFWKLQQAPVLAVLDRIGRGDWIDAAELKQAALLPVLRVGALWIWVVAWGITTFWARRLYGPRAMLFAAWWFALSPNLLAHGALVTMETPLIAATTGVFFLFWRFLVTGRARDFWLAAAFSGLAFSCKFTSILLPPLLAVVWWVDLVRDGSTGPMRATWRVSSWMIGFVALMLAADFLVTGCAVLPLSHSPGAPHPALNALKGRPVLMKLAHRLIETPTPQDWVGFVTQLQHQRSGGPSYLFGVRRMTGWWYYYFVALAVKAPLGVFVLLAVRSVVAGKSASIAPNDRAWMFPVIIGAFLAVTAAGSSRNYGVRYLLPLAPLAIVWGSALAERPGWPRAVAWAGVLGSACSVALVHPNELTYFNMIAGGPRGGRVILADSNLDWGQGLRALARLQHERPEFSGLTLYYFGDTEPSYYGVVGVSYVIDAVGAHAAPPSHFEADTRLVAVSASLQYGPWGPPGYFDRLKGVKPVAFTDDTTIAIYLCEYVFTP